MVNLAERQGHKVSGLREHPKTAGLPNRSNKAKGENVEKRSEESLREKDTVASLEIDEEWLDLMFVAQSIGLSPEEVRQYIRSHGHVIEES